MWKDSPVRRSKLEYPYPSAQFSHRRNHYPNIPWLKLFQGSLPFHMWLDENIQMNQQIDRIARRNLKRNSIGANTFRNENVPSSRYQKSDTTIEFSRNVIRVIS